MKKLNDPNFIYDFIVFHCNKYNTHFNPWYNVYICPFVDDLYLQLKHPEKHFMRTLLALLLCPDLLDITLYGFTSEPPYKFHEEFAFLIPKVEEFIQQYDLRNRVFELKAKVSSAKIKRKR